MPVLFENEVFARHRVKWQAKLRLPLSSEVEASATGQGNRVLTLVLMAALSVGCNAQEGPAELDSASADNSVLKTQVERGPVKFTVEVSPENPRLSDEPKLTLTIRSEAGVRVEKPPFGQAMGDFVIRDFYEPVPDVESGAEVIQQVYTLEPTKAGKLMIAPITVRFFDERKTGDRQEHTIESEALAVEVSSVLAEEIPSLTDLRPAASPVELPVTYATNWLYAGVACVVLFVAGLAVWRIRRGRAVAERQLTPQELARLELGKIVDQKLAESDVKGFYVELTGVVRRYIERSTGVNAPEQTTEEFLRQIIDDAVFADEDQLRLKGFLEAADLVKFAAFEPEQSDVDSSIDRARNFIQLQQDASPKVAI